MKESIKITSHQHKELCTNVTAADKKYLILTEDLGVSEHRIITKVYLGGKIISTRNNDYKTILKKPDFESKLRESMQAQHQTVIHILKQERDLDNTSPMKYLDKVMALLQDKDYQGALDLLAGVLKQYPDEPYILSYYGCLDAILNKNYRKGIQTCVNSITMLGEKVPFGQEFFYPILYLNLGRAYLASGSKKKSVEAFQKGLSFDPENKELLKEVKKLGVRKKPVVRYLSRSNPINKYIGRMLHKFKKNPVKKGKNQ